MSSRLKYYFMLVMAGLLCVQCANKLSIEGGPKDEQPPQINRAESSRNFQTNFKAETFTLTFDEFVQVRNPSEQIVVSPPLQYPLTPTTRGKKIIFEFHPDEQLLENTTYAIQFGDAIQDYTEGNALINERFVFSTGASIDSASVRASVVDLATGLAVADALVILYDNMSDTMIRKGRPFYFSKTDSFGIATIENVKEGQYRLMALVDENRNYMLDLPTEKLGHIDTLITASFAPSEVFSLVVYPEIDPPRNVKTVRTDSLIYGVVLSGEPQYATWATIPTTTIETIQSKDTTYIKLAEAAEALLLSSPYAETIDTINLSTITRTSSLSERFASMTLTSLSTQTNGSRVTATVLLTNAIDRANLDSIRVLSADSTWLPLPQATIEPAVSPIKFSFSWNHDEMADSLIFFPGALTSWRATNDTTIRGFRAVELDNLSNLLIDINNLDGSKSYIAQLKKGEELLFEKIIADTTAATWEIPNLRPTEYDLYLITDENKNGQRDGGWFDTRQLPEAVATLKIDNLRPDWDVQVAIRPK